MNQYCWFFGCPRVQESHSHVFLCVPDQIPNLRFSWICWKVDMKREAIGYILGGLETSSRSTAFIAYEKAGPWCRHVWKASTKEQDIQCESTRLLPTVAVLFYVLAALVVCFASLCMSFFFFLFWLLCSCCSHDIVWRLTQPSSSSFSE